MAGLRIANDLGIDRLRVYSDSQLVVGQMKGEFEARDPVMTKYLQEAKCLASPLKHFEILHIPRVENARADSLSRLATSSVSQLGRTMVEYLDRPSIEDVKEILQVVPESSWMDPIKEYLLHGILPEGPVEAKRIRWRAAQYVLLEGQLYKRSFSLPLLKCLGPTEARYALREVHEGICGNHLGGRSLAYKILRQGYYWPTMRQDAREFVRKCDECQRYANVQRQPASYLASISAPWPFAQWGMDILGPFPPATGQRRFLVVAVDYFTKWVEAEPLAHITEGKMEDFVRKSIIYRFGLPHTIITDNGRQFDNARFEEFCAEFQITHKLTSVAHPQSNGEAEVTNRTILHGLKTRLNGAKGLWVEELHPILWAYRTTPRIPTGETPYNLAFGSEAVIPMEMGLPSIRVQHYQEPDNSERRRTDLDLLPEIRSEAQIRMASYQQRVARHYNRRVREKVFRPGDLVLRKTEVSRPTEQGKLFPNWEGPYRVAETLRRGAYKLEHLDGSLIPRTWNADNLRVYYQ